MPRHPRGPHERVGGLVWFGRMVDKIRLSAAGELDPESEPLRGKGLDGRLLELLEVPYVEIEGQVLGGLSDEEVLTWCFESRPGGPPDARTLRLWNHYLTKLGWRDESSHGFEAACERYGIPLNDPKIQTFFDIIDRDEGRI
ncbi:MAG: DUF5069 domain-containing protein [Opitutales bacterium]